MNTIFQCRQGILFSVRDNEFYYNISGNKHDSYDARVHAFLKLLLKT